MKNGIRFFCFVTVFALAAATGNPARAGEVGAPEIDAKSAVLIDAASGETLYARNPDERLPIASVTKIMTLLLIMEALDTERISIDDTVVVSEYACSMGGSQVYLEPGEQMSVSDMIKAIAVASANDASVAMAEHITGSEAAFVNAMNKRAKALGMANTNFVNCNGLDAENQYCSAFDVAVMSRELLRHKGILRYLSIWMDSLRDGKFGLANTNKLIRFYPGAVGIKTGSTDSAKYCLSAAASREDMTLIAVVLAAPTTAERFGGASRLLDYGFANYTVIRGAEQGGGYGTIAVSKGREAEVEAVAGEDFKTLLPKEKKGSTEVQAVLPGEVTAPVKANEKIGDLLIFSDGEQIGKVDLVA
ncbi:MAG: D-alanyl-D-alanine carboxypeptidase, partial [Clostridiales bacterium]|nr:D-alanyl-D-alanine carboxypeptidase [Clostridiales bacterium]